MVGYRLVQVINITAVSEEIAALFFWVERRSSSIGGFIQEHDILSRTVIGQNGINVTLMRLELERLPIQIWSQTNATAISIATSSRHMT
jgi:hypothetical protein